MVAAGVSRGCGDRSGAMGRHAVLNQLSDQEWIPQRDEKDFFWSVWGSMTNTDTSEEPESAFDINCRDRLVWQA